MKQTGSRRLVIASENFGHSVLIERLASIGWEVEQIDFPSLLEVKLDCDSPFVLVADTDSADKFLRLIKQLPEQITAAAATCPLLESASAEDVVACFRAGAADVLLSPLEPDSTIGVLESVSRQLEEGLRSRTELERTNRELQESLKILRLDQVAGRQAQQSMLPSSPMVHGEYFIAHQIVPSLYLSGDFVGYNFVFDRYLLFYFADVSGHGSSSAFVTFLLRFLLSRILRRHINEEDRAALARAPEGLVESINRYIISTGLEKHLTMFAGAIDMEKNMLRYVVAAQMPMPILVVDGNVRFLPGKGKPVGLFEGAAWEVYEISLPKRFTLSLVSDGVMDHLPGNNLTEKEQFLLAAIRDAGYDFVRIQAELNLNSIKDAADDMTLITVIRGGDNKTESSQALRLEAG